MSNSESDFALPYIQRKQKNLAYFQKYRPEIYQFFVSFEPRRCELVLTPGASDVDMTDGGISIYRRGAREYSCSEVEKFLSENPPGAPVKTLAPPRVVDETLQKADRFAYRAIKQSVSAAQIEPSSYDGYSCGKVYPSIIFLGCGLGFHIEEFVNSADVLDVVIFEPDPERFALSLFTVDWEEICRQFRGRGRSISFTIASAIDSAHFKRVMGSKLAEIVPLYPYVSRYYNHLANVELHKAIKELERDIHVVAANWSDYDFELFPYRNSFHNLNQQLELFIPGAKRDSHSPLAICGSGPSLDSRVHSLAQVREKVVIVSAGTGLRALLKHGIRPDYHVEVDPTHLIYDLLVEVSEDFGLEDITLIYGISVNPLVPGLFDESIAFFSASNYIPALFDQWGNAIEGANATCTNAALALSQSCGARNIYLFGTDYGFEDEAQTHSNFSVYGADSSTPQSEQLREDEKKSKRIVFPVKGVKGKTILTRGDYLTAKQTVEHLVADVKTGCDSLRIQNCSDGADITGVPWINSSDFLLEVSEWSVENSPIKFEEFSTSVPPFPVHERYSLVALEVKDLAMDLMRVLRHGRLNGKRDLLILSNEIRVLINRVGWGSGRKSEIPVQLTAWGIVKGVILQFVQIAVTYGLAHPKETLRSFVLAWRDAFEAFLCELPEHFAGAMLSSSGIHDDPLVVSSFKDDEYLS